MSNASMMAALALMSGRDEGLKALGTQYPIARKDITDAEYYQPFYNIGVGGLNMLYNGLGLNGEYGKNAALGAFQTGPGYQFQRDQGIEALNRSAASRGMLASGNNTQDIMKFSQGLADQTYGNWLTRLSGLADTGLSAAGGQQQRQGMLSGLDYGYGTDQAGIWQNTARSLADVAMQQEKIDSQKKNGTLSAILGGVNLIGGLLTPSRGGN